MSCEERQVRVEAIAVERGVDAIDADERAHLEGCANCSSQLAVVAQLIDVARQTTPHELPEEILATVRARSSRALRAARARRILRGRNVAPLAVALLALPIAIAQGWLWIRGLEWVLEPWVPASVITALIVFYVASAALALGGLYGSLPFAVAYSNRNRLEAR